MPSIGIQTAGPEGPEDVAMGSPREPQPLPGHWRQHQFPSWKRVYVRRSQGVARGVRRSRLSLSHEGTVSPGGAIGAAIWSFIAGDTHHVFAITANSALVQAAIPRRGEERSSTSKEGEESRRTSEGEGKAVKLVSRPLIDQRSA